MAYNKTQLDPLKSFERHIFHRDQFAHYLRWSFFLRYMKKDNAKILDIGCGSGNLYELLYRNRYSPIYTGIDVRSKTIENNRMKFPKAKFVAFDICSLPFIEDQFDYITCFEVFEHVPGAMKETLIINIMKSCSNDTKVLLSTPNYNGVDCAENHIIDGEICEWPHEKTKALLEKYFNIEAMYGTFCSKRDVYHLLAVPHKWMYDTLSDYYDSNILSVMFAPLFPVQSRNCLFVLSLKDAYKGDMNE